MQVTGTGLGRPGRIQYSTWQLSPQLTSVIFIFRDTSEAKTAFSPLLRRRAHPAMPFHPSPGPYLSIAETHRKTSIQSTQAAQ